MPIIERKEQLIDRVCFKGLVPEIYLPKFGYGYH